MATGRSWTASGHVRVGREGERGDDRRHLVRGAGDEFAPASQDLRHLLDRVEGARKGDDWTHRVEAERERRHDTEVSAAATDGPVQVGVGFRRGGTNLTVGAHHLGLDDVVAGEAVLASQPSVTSAESEATHAGVGDNSARRSQAEQLSLAVDVSPEGAPLDPTQLPLGVDVHTVHG